MQRTATLVVGTGARVAGVVSGFDRISADILRRNPCGILTDGDKPQTWARDNLVEKPEGFTNLKMMRAEVAELARTKSA